MPSAAAATSATSPMTSAAATSAAATMMSLRKPYVWAKSSFSVKNVKSPQVDVRYFLLSEKDPGFRALRRHLQGGCIR